MKKLNSCFLKRDAYLSHLLAKELPRLIESTKDLKQSDFARRYIAGELKKSGTRTVNIVIDKQLAHDLNQVVKNTNMVRDAFFNRLVVLASVSNSGLVGLGLTDEVSIDRVHDFEPDIELCPLKNLHEQLKDPLYYLHKATDSDLYQFQFNKSFHFLSCYMKDEDIPTSEEYALRNAKLNEVLSGWEEK